MRHWVACTATCDYRLSGLSSGLWVCDSTRSKWPRHSGPCQSVVKIRPPAGPNAVTEPPVKIRHPPGPIPPDYARGVPDSTKASAAYDISATANAADTEHARARRPCTPHPSPRECTVTRAQAREHSGAHALTNQPRSKLRTTCCPFPRTSPRTPPTFPSMSFLYACTVSPLVRKVIRDISLFIGIVILLVVSEESVVGRADCSGNEGEGLSGLRSSCLSRECA